MFYSPYMHTCFSTDVVHTQNLSYSNDGICMFDFIFSIFILWDASFQTTHSRRGRAEGDSLAATVLCCPLRPTATSAVGLILVARKTDP